MFVLVAVTVCINSGCLVLTFLLGRLLLVALITLEGEMSVRQ